MKYKVSLSGWGRFFNIPCSVVDEYIKLASASQIKVLLYILCNGESFTTEEISENTGVKASEVDDSVVFWCKNNVLKVDGISEEAATLKKETPANSSENTAIKPSASVLSSEVVSAVSAKVEKSPRLSPSQLDEIISKNKDLQNLLLQTQDVLCREITYYDSHTLVELFSDYGFSSPSIILLLEYCKVNGKISSGLAYLKTIAKDWISRDIITYADVEAEIIRLTEAAKIENKITRAMQLQGRLSTKQKSYIKEWSDNKYSIDLIMLAYDRCLDNIQKVEFKYINSILSSWNEKGIKTVEQAENEQVPEFKRRQRKPQSSLSENKEHSYDLKEIENHALMHTPKLKKKG